LQVLIISDCIIAVIPGNLPQEVIGGLVDGAIPLDDDSVGVIRDTLAILASKEIKLTTLRR
jgi:hypothetical protein